MKVAASGVVCLLWLALYGGCATGPATREGPSGTRLLLSEGGRYHLTLPDALWRPLRAASFSPEAETALAHGGGDALLLVFSEPAGRARLDEFIRHSRSHARLIAAGGSSWTSAEATEVSGDSVRFPAWLIERHVERALSLHAYALITVAGGTGYHVLCWGNGRNPSLAQTCLAAVRGFHPRVPPSLLHSGVARVP